MTRKEIAELALDYTNNYYTKYRENYIKVYKYRGEIRHREESRLNAEGERVNALLNEQKIFICPDCGEAISALDLELWLGDSLEDLVNNRICCSECYENAMGEDL